MRNFILLFVNGQQHRVTGSDAFLTLSDFLRLRLSLCGTKIVCSEGDCGSCSVLCGKITTDDIEYRPIDSCIRFVFQLDGHHVVTIEGIGTEREVSQVQQAMIDCHGSQCGFCTPGFVVAMTGLIEESNERDGLDEEQWRTGLTGNLCRCTGYSPIIDAALKCNASNTQAIEERFPGDAMYDVAKNSDEPILVETTNETGTNKVYCPTTVAAAVEFLAANPDTRIVAGATDVGVQFNNCLLYTSPSPRDATLSRMPSSA